MSGIAASLIAGAGAGLSIAVPFGPTSLLCIERTLADGMRAGIVTGLGVATVHLTYSTIAMLGGLALVGSDETGTFLMIFSGVVLLFFAYRLWMRQLQAAVRQDLPPSVARLYCGAVGFGFLNPVTPALCAAAVTAFAGSLSMPGTILVLGVFAGSLAWWFVLSTAVSLLRRRLHLRHLHLANRAAGVFLACLAVTLLVRGLNMLSRLVS